MRRYVSNCLKELQNCFSIPFTCKSSRWPNIQPDFIISDLKINSRLFEKSNFIIIYVWREPKFLLRPNLTRWQCRIAREIGLDCMYYCKRIRLYANGILLAPVLIWLWPKTWWHWLRDGLVDNNRSGHSRPLAKASARHPRDMAIYVSRARSKANKWRRPSPRATSVSPSFSISQ